MDLWPANGEPTGPSNRRKPKGRGSPGTRSKPRRFTGWTKWPRKRRAGGRFYRSSGSWLPLKPPEAKGARVAWHEVKAATIYRVDQVAQKASGRRQILQKFWVLDRKSTR